MFKLCFNSTTLRNIDLFEAFRQIYRHGYDGVELTLNDTHLHPIKHNGIRIDEIKAFCEINRIEIACVSAGGPNLLGKEPYEPSLINADPSAREKRIEFIKRSIELAQTLNAPVLNINSGRHKMEIPPDEAYDHLCEGIHILLPQVGNLILAIEPEPDFFIERSDQAVDFIKEINSPNLKLNLDIGHVFCSEYHCYKRIENALPYTRHIHMEDIKNGVHHHEIPGEGDIDFHRVVNLIKQSGYAHYVSVELHHHDMVWQKALKASREYLMRFI